MYYIIETITKTLANFYIIDINNCIDLNISAINIYIYIYMYIYYLCLYIVCYLLRS